MQWCTWDCFHEQPLSCRLRAGHTQGRHSLQDSTLRQLKADGGWRVCWGMSPFPWKLDDMQHTKATGHRCQTSDSTPGLGRALLLVLVLVLVLVVCATAAPGVSLRQAKPGLRATYVMNHQLGRCAWDGGGGPLSLGDVDTRRVCGWMGFLKPFLRVSCGSANGWVGS